MTFRLRKDLFVALLVGLLFAAIPAGDARALTVGVGDNGPHMFDDARYQSLDMRISRKIIPYDFYRSQFERDQLSAWLAGAKREGVRPLIAFSHSHTRPKKLPSVREFQTALRNLRRLHPEVRDFSPWNEANHHTQPTWSNPKRAAQFYNTARKICRGCRIIAADVLDIKNMLRWVKEFKRHAYKPTLWGLHSYYDANHNTPWRKSSVKLLLDNVRGNVWMTEVGGLVAFSRAYRYSERRGANGLRNTLRLARKSRRIQRVYLYSWYGTVHSPRRPPYSWDSGIVAADGAARPAYFTLKRWFDSFPGDR